MEYDKLAFFVSLGVLALQGVNLYISTSIKLWAVEKFVTKKDFLDTIHMWAKETR